MYLSVPSGLGGYRWVQVGAGGCGAGLAQVGAGGHRCIVFVLCGMVLRVGNQDRMWPVRRSCVQLGPGQASS